jgi:signal transduction histidine kinase
MVEIKAKDEALIELEAFSHTVAHDLKNPLSAMITLAGELRSTGAEPELVNPLLEAGQQCYRIIDDILVLSSVRGEQVTPVRVDMLACLSEVLTTLRWLFHEHGVTLDVPESLPPALGRHNWVAQIWMNFLTNAVRYGGRPPRIRIGSYSGDGWIRYWVEDNGPGIPEPERERIFAPFKRLDDLSLTGSGLGLSIVRRILERLEGDFGVTAGEGGGARFHFQLPAAR